MANQTHRPLTLEESKQYFRLAVQVAGGGLLGRIKVRHLSLGALLVGFTLGVSPGARQALGMLLTKYLSSHGRP